MAPAKGKAPPAGIAAPAGEEAYDLDEESVGDEGAAGPAAAKAQVSINKLIRPGASLSGDVTFASGAKGEWWVDERGRLGLNPAAGSAKPTQDDVLDFQQALQDEVRKKYGR